MANYYVEPKSYPAYTATPPNTTTAYDGDGLAKGLAAPAYVTINLTAYTADAGDTVTVCGCVLTCVASGAAANQFNAGAGSTLAANLAASIIAATNAVNAAATNWTTPQLRNACYASSSGANLTIQTRAGSATYNSNASWKVVSTGLTDGGSNVQLDASFASGVSGAWNYLYNDTQDGTTIWPSAVAQRSYGAWLTGSNAAPLAGPSNAIDPETDTVHIKGTGAILYASADNENASRQVSINRAAHYLFDDGTEWSGATGGIQFRSRQNSVYVETYSVNGAKSSLVGRSVGCVVFGSSSLAYRGRVAVSNNASTQLVLDCLKFETPAVGGSSSGAYVAYAATGATSEFQVLRCKWSVLINTFYSPITLPNSGYASWGLVVEDCVFDFNLYAGASLYLISLGSTSSASNSALVAVRNCEYIGSVKPTVFGNNGGASISMIAENCTNFTVNQNVGYVGGIAAPSHGESPSYWAIQQGLTSPQQFRHETPLTLLEFDPDGAYPYLNSYLVDGNPWSIKTQWSALAACNRWRGVEIIRRATFVSQASMTKVALELLFDSAASPKMSDFGLVVAYTRASDSKRVVERHNQWQNRYDSTAITTTGAGSWTKPGAYSSYVARKLQLTLSGAIKQNTNIDIQLVCYKAAPSTYAFFVNPEPTIEA